jgi:hypothetical protein
VAKLYNNLYQYYCFIFKKEKLHGAFFSRFHLKILNAYYFCFYMQQPPSPKIIVCRMDRLPFITIFSPFIAIQITRRAAKFGAPKEIAKKKNMYF